MGLEVSFESGKKVQSQGLFQKAEKVIPGGISANIKYFSPHPIVMEKASGSKLFDVDGEEYIDYSLCYGALITGHGHEQITSATTKYMESIGTTIFGTPHRLEITMAEKLIELYPSIDMVRYTNSGLEATLFAIRLATAYTGKSKIGKFEGHYHGGYNEVLVSVNPNKQEAGEAGNPSAVPESKGIPESQLNQTIILPFNDLKATEQILRDHAHELAAVILEPVQGGFIPAEPEFLKGLRKITKDFGILLIFDEVKTGFRAHLGGAQSVYNITPDLTALGKVLGGGFPVGAIGGRRDIMVLSAPNADSDVFSVDGKSRKKNDVVFHSGTYNGHPVVLSAGLETIKLLEEDNTMEQLFKQTNKLRKQLEELYASYEIPMQTIGMGSIFNIVLSLDSIRNYRDMWRADNKLREAIDRELLDLGVFLKPLNRYSMSTVHNDVDIRKTVDAHEEAIKRLLI